MHWCVVGPLFVTPSFFWVFFFLFSAPVLLHCLLLLLLRFFFCFLCFVVLLPGPVRSSPLGFVSVSSFFWKPLVCVFASSCVSPLCCSFLCEKPSVCVLSPVFMPPFFFSRSPSPSVFVLLIPLFVLSVFWFSVCVSSVFLFFVPHCFFVPLPRVAFLWLFKARECHAIARQVKGLAGQLQW